MSARPITITLPEEFLKWLAAESRETRQSKSSIIRQGLVMYSQNRPAVLKEG